MSWLERGMGIAPAPALAMRRAILRNGEGASAVEHVLVLALVALFAAGAWRSLGDAVHTDARCAAAALGAATAPCPTRESTGRTTSAATSAALAQSEGEALHASDASDPRGARLAASALRLPDTISFASEAGGALGDAARSAWDATEGIRDAVATPIAWTLELAQRVAWLAGLPVIGPDQEDDYDAFRANVGPGVRDWFVGIGRGLWSIGEGFVDRGLDAARALQGRDFTTFARLALGIDLVPRLPRLLWNGLTGIVSGLWHQIDTLAVGPPAEAGRAGASLALDIASVTAPGAVARRVARSARVVESSVVPEGEAIALEATARTVLERERLLEIMERGSLNVSRTKVFTGARRSWRSRVPNRIRTWAPMRSRFAPRGTVPAEQIAEVAERNFVRAAELVVDEAERLPLTLETATRINRIVTEDLVPERVRGMPAYRRNPAEFYRWLESPEARALGESDPVALAERIHFEISRLDAFPDGNGRTARLMADLALIKHGRAPAFYTDIGEYFERGNARAAATRAEQLAYFRESVARGERALEHGLPDP